MGKIANATKPYPHTFEFNGEPFTLLIRTDFTTEEFETVQRKVKRAKDEQDAYQLAEICNFLLVSWDVEGPDGLINIKDTKEITAIVPFLLLEAITTQAQKAIVNGGLVKKN